MPVVTAKVGSIAIGFDVDVAIAAAVRRLAKSGTFYFVRRDLLWLSIRLLFESS